MREIVAACIHEPFIIRREDEDISVIQQVVCELMEESERQVVQILAPKINIVIEHYVNNFQLQDSSEQPKSPKENNQTTFKHSSTLAKDKVSCMDLDRIGDKKKG